MQCTMRWEMASRFPNLRQLTVYLGRQGEHRQTRLNSCLLTCVVAEPGAAVPRGLEALVSCLIIRQSFLFWLLVWNLQPYWTSFGFTHWPCSLWLWKLGITCAWNIISLLFAWLTPTLPSGISIDAVPAGGSPWLSPHAGLDEPVMCSQSPVPHLKHYCHNTVYIISLFLLL